MSGLGQNRCIPARRRLFLPLILSALMLAGFLGGGVLPAAAHPGALLEESSKRECAVCHVMWMDEFQMEEEETLIPWVGENVLMKSTYGVVSEEEMCYSCHDGYIADSRLVWTGKSHTVFEKPSDEVTIDQDRFPLSVDEEIYCGTCHTIHSARTGEVDEISYDLFLRQSNANSELCLACHQDYDAGPGVGLHSVGEEIEAGFPVSLGDLRLRPGRTGEADEVICNSCHVVHAAQQEESLLPVAAGMANFCGACHQDQNIRRAGAGDFLAHVMDVPFEEAEFPEEFRELGSELEDDKLTCQTCHNLHQGRDDRALLIMEETRESELCLSCHDNQEVIKDTPHNLLVTDQERQLQNLNRQHVGEAGLCGICHGAHGWQQEMRAGEDSATEACNTCHGPGRDRMELELAGPYSHSVGVDLDGASPREDVELPLYNHDFTAGDRVYCNTCHDSHQSLGQVYGTPEGRDERGLIATNFLRLEEYTELCSQCHQQEMVVEGLNHDPRLFELEYRNIRGETPEMTGACGACHLMHEGPEPVGFAVASPEVDYPEEIRRNQENLYCLSCHEADRVGREKLIGQISHPMGERPEEGESSQELAEQEVTCLSCHDVHRWAPDQTEPGPGRLLEGDLSSSFLLVDNRRGELCAECHRTPALVIDSEHDLSDHPRRDVETGVCEQCHASHNAHEDLLWGRDLSGVLPGEKEQNRRCLDCHRPGEPGEETEVTLYRHPDYMLLTDPAMLGQLELEDPRATMEAVEQDFVCGTCHDPHVWSQQMLLREDELEVSRQESFLKMGDPAATFCVDCHREEARTRYLYYHDERVRTEDSPYYAEDPIEALRELLKRFRGD